MKKPKKRYVEMTKRELAAATREYDREMLDVPAVPVPPEVRARHDRIIKKRGRGRPVVGRGAKRVLITVERGLLTHADSYARRQGMSRSELIALGLKMAMKANARASRARA